MIFYQHRLFFQTLSNIKFSNHFSMRINEENVIPFYEYLVLKKDL
uniref:Uncharacterized protein n=1 Tax=Iridovirus sp. TaxID=135728 RepID=A0AAU7YDH3_9VIRU